MPNEYYVERRVARKHEAVVDRVRLERLEAVERAHDAYVRATRAMRVKQASMLDRTDPYAEGWRGALRTFAELVARED